MPKWPVLVIYSVTVDNVPPGPSGTTPYNATMFGWWRFGSICASLQKSFVCQNTIFIYLYRINYSSYLKVLMTYQAFLFWWFPSKTTFSYFLDRNICSPPFFVINSSKCTWIHVLLQDQQFFIICIFYIIVYTGLIWKFKVQHTITWCMLPEDHAFLLQVQLL